MQGKTKIVVKAFTYLFLFLGSAFMGLRAMSRAESSVPYMASSLQGELDSLNKERETRIQMKQADRISYNASLRPGIHCFIGNVIFRHGDAVMRCDSAYLHDKSQIFEAFGQVEMNQGDSINIYANYLYYDGQTKIAKLRQKVMLENPTTKLFTDSLDYDRITDIGYYFNGGTIVDTQNTLTSDYGEFHPQTNDAEFHENVILHNDSTELTTEHFFYNTERRIGRFQGESLIKADSGVIISRRGIYDLNSDVGILLDRSELISGSRKLIGDSIYFDGNARSGEAFGRMELIDTAQKSNLYGDYGFFDNKRHYAFATSRAYAMDYSNKDTLYIGADTLEMLSFPMPDSIYLSNKDKGMDSLMREIRAYHRVRVFRHDAQAMADSMTYISLDSILYLYDKPILWQEERQALGDTILFKFNEKKLDYVDVLGNTFSTEQLKDLPEHFNQMSGTNMRVWIRDSVLNRIDVHQPVEMITFMQDEKTRKFNGMVHLKSDDMTVFFKEDSQLEKVVWVGEPKAKIYPMSFAMQGSVSRLKAFRWEKEVRPKSPKDVVGRAFVFDADKEEVLSRLASISGAKAALKAYEAFEREQAEFKKRQAEALKKLLEETADKKVDYTYVLRPKEVVQSTNKTKDYTEILWLYNPFLIPEKAKSSNISPYTLIREKKNLIIESNVSEKK